MTVVYLDSVFLLNALMDYILLLATARLSGIGLRRKRYLLAALLGGGYAAAVFLPGLEFLGRGSVKAAVGILLALLAFGGEARLFRLMLILLFLSCALAGGVLVLGMAADGGIPAVAGILYTNVDMGVLLAAATAAYLLLTAVFRASARNGIEGRLLPVRIALDGKVLELTALWDSGNGLADFATGRPVLILAKSAAERLLPWLDRWGAPGLEILRSKVPQLKPILLPYRAVGTEGGLLLSVRSAWTEIGGRRYEDLRVALVPHELGNGYTALWGGEIGEGDGK